MSALRRIRSAVTGRFVGREEAARDPDRTVAEDVEEDLALSRLLAAARGVLAEEGLYVGVAPPSINRLRRAVQYAEERTS